VHSTHAPLLEHAAPFGQSSSHATQATPSQMGSVPPQSPFVEHDVQPGSSWSGTNEPDWHVSRTPSSQRSVPSTHTQLPVVASHWGVSPPQLEPYHNPAVQTWCAPVSVQRSLPVSHRQAPSPQTGKSAAQSASLRHSTHSPS
jgi:hypothetical protein